MKRSFLFNFFQRISYFAVPVFPLITMNSDYNSAKALFILPPQIQQCRKHCQNILIPYSAEKCSLLTNNTTKALEKTNFSFSFFFLRNWSAFLLTAVERKKLLWRPNTSHTISVPHFYSLELGWIIQTHWSHQRSPPAHGCIHTARVYILCSILPCICNERGSSGNQNRAAIFLLTRISWHQKHTEALMWEWGDTQEYNRLAGTQIWEQEQTTSAPAGPEEENDGCVVLPVAQLSKPNGSVF